MISTTVGASLPFPIEEYQDRWRKVYAEMNARGYETAVVWSRSGGSYDRAGALTYLNNYASHASGQEWSSGSAAIGRSFAALVFHAGEEPVLHIAEPVSTVELPYVATGKIYEHTEDLGRQLVEHLVQQGIGGNVAYVGYDFMPLQMWESISAASGEITWVPEDTLLYRAQSHKSELELDLYREGGEISGAALKVFMEALIRGERQCDAAAEAASLIIRSGGGFQRVACHTGPRSELAMWDNPFYGYSTDRAKSNDLVRAWVYGPVRHGYWIDPGRSSFGPDASPAQRRLVENGVEITEHLISLIRAGKTPREVGIEGDAYTQKIGLSDDTGGGIWDLYGHGLSTFWHGPIIPAHPAATFPAGDSFDDVDTPFHVGQVFTVETFMREPGVGTATFEEVFIVQQDGVERVTLNCPMSFY